MRPIWAVWLVMAGLLLGGAPPVLAAHAPAGPRRDELPRFTTRRIARLATGRSDAALSPGCLDFGGDAASECPASFVFRDHGDDLLVWDGPHGNLKRLRIGPRSGSIAQVIPGPAISGGHVPFDGIVEPDGTIAIVTEKGLPPEGRFHLYRLPPGAKKWSDSVMDSAQVPRSIREPLAWQTDKRLSHDGGRLVLRDGPPWVARGSTGRPLGRDRAGHRFVETAGAGGGTTLELLSADGRRLAVGEIPRTVWPGDVMLETGERDKIVCDDGSLLVLAWSQRALTIYRMIPPRL